ncbi:MAG TPA: YcxB family protein [Thermoanaerobaculia bacterium]|nr:YcxB family protein [Thermoanaerobaculia bacterium]
MKVRFEFQIDDLIDVGERTLAASRVVKRIRLSGLLSSSVLGAILLYAMSGDSGPARPFYVVSGAIIGAVAYPPLRKSTTERRLRAFWRERLGSEGPFVCEVELTEGGVTTRQFGTESTRPWSKVKAVEEGQGSVDIFTAEGLIVVRDRAFASPDEKKRFLDLGRSLLARG